jgi:hypothetical protein
MAPRMSNRSGHVGRNHAHVEPPAAMGGTPRRSVAERIATALRTLTEFTDHRCAQPMHDVLVSSAIADLDPALTDLVQTPPAGISDRQELIARLLAAGLTVTPLTPSASCPVEVRCELLKVRGRADQLREARAAGRWL